MEYKFGLLVYKCLHQAAPSYLAEMCLPVAATDNRCHVCSATLGDLAVPRVRLGRYGRRSFSVSGPLPWNSLPLTVCDVSLTLTQFCTRLKTFLFPGAYETSSQRLCDSFGCKVCLHEHKFTYLLTLHFFSVIISTFDAAPYSPYTLLLLHFVTIWLSGNTLASINVVALRQTRLVPGWVTICGRVNHLGM